MSDTPTAIFGRFTAEITPALACLTIREDGHVVVQFFGRDLILSALRRGSWPPDMGKAMRWGLARVEEAVGEDLRYRAGVMAACETMRRLSVGVDVHAGQTRAILLGEEPPKIEFRKAVGELVDCVMGMGAKDR